MSSFAGLGSLLRLVLRRERIAIPVWIIVFTALPAATASAFRTLYPTDAVLERAAGGIASNPAFVSFLGPVYRPSLGGITVWRVNVLLAALLGIVSVLTLVRHTRAEEQAGRRELVGSAAIGRQAPLAAALIGVLAIDVLAGAGSAVGLIGSGLSTNGALAFGSALAATGVVFAGVAAIAAQLPESSRTSNGIGMAVVASSFLLRVAGDAGGASGLGFLGWISPIGLAQRVRPFADERWWVIGVLAAIAVVLLGVGWTISSRRDVGAGVLVAGLGPAVAAPSLSGPIGLAWRLHRGLTLAWAIGFLIFGFVIGSVTNGFATLMEETPQLAEILERMGGASIVTDAFLAAILGVFAGIASAHGVQAVLRLRVEETDLRADDILATGVTRPAWLTSHATFGLVGPVVDLGLAGFGAGLAYGLSIDDVGGQIPRLIGASMTHLPAVLVVVALSLALVGVVPRYSVVLGWTVVAVSVLLALLGAAMGLDQWLLDLSPFTHTPSVPTASPSWTPLLYLTGLAAALTVVAFVGFRRRDIGDTG